MLLRKCQFYFTSTIKILKHFDFKFFEIQVMKIFDTKLAIIGAGISGVSCAITLLDNRFDDFYIFEANERIGGRCFTVPCGIKLFLKL